MGGYVDSNLNPGESVVYRASLHWIIYLFPIVLLLFGLTLAVTGVRTGMLILPLGAIAALGAWMRQVNSEFAVTTQRVVIKTGWLARRTIELNLSRVESVQVDQGIIGRLLNYGAITVVGTGGTREPFPMIDSPLEFRRAVQAQQG